MKTWNARKGESWNARGGQGLAHAIEENHGELTRQLASVWIAGDEGFSIAQQMAKVPEMRRALQMLLDAVDVGTPIIGGLMFDQAIAATVVQTSLHKGAEILADELRTSRLAFSGALLEISTLKRQRGELIEALQDIVNSANDLERDAYHIKVARTALKGAQ